jgi:hypothetical protein
MAILKGICFLLCFIFADFLQGQISFFKAYSDNGHDFGEGITQLPDSSYLVTGYSSSFSNSPSKVFILKIDSLGNYLWSRAYGGSESNIGRRIFSVPNDGIYVAGYTNSIGNGSFDFYFFKTDEIGNFLWEKTYGMHSFERVHDAVMLKDTSFILVGETTSTPNEVEDIYIVRVDKNGGLIWEKTIGGVGSDVAKGIKIMNDTTVIICGNYYDESSDFQKAMLLKLHIDGQEEWLNLYGNNQEYGLNDLVVLTNRIISVGYNNINNVGNNEYFLIANLEGNSIEQGVVSKAGEIVKTHITQYGQGKFYITFQAKDVPSYPTFPDGKEDVVIERFASAFYWDNGTYYPSNLGHDQGNQIISTSDGGAIMVGYNSHPNFGGNSVILVKFGPNENYPSTTPDYNQLVSLENIPKEQFLSLYPNPTEGFVTVLLKNQTPFFYKIFDLTGKEIKNSTSSKEGKIDFSNYQTGMYFLEIEVDTKISYLFKITKK